MDLFIRPMTEQEQLYAYRQSSQIAGQTGNIGYLRGDFGSGGEQFYTTWEDIRSDFKTDTFKTEFDNVVNALRFDERYGLLIGDRRTLAQYCARFPESLMKGSDRWYGFRIESGDYSYLLRLSSTQGDYNFYINCYKQDFFNSHMKRAENGIRFITPDYDEKFRVQDGDMIRIVRSDGTARELTCRYIDETYVEIGNGWDSIFHICQFAEEMERCGNTVIPLRSSLPEQCYSTLLDTGMIVILKKGEMGYYKTDIPYTDIEEAKEIADQANEKLGVTKAQAEAMKAGSLFGWAVPAADPANYDEQGQPILKKNRDRGEAR